MSLDTPNHDVLPHFTGVTALANAIPDMRALTSLNLSSNRLNARGARVIADAIKVSKCAIAIVLVYQFHVNLITTGSTGVRCLL
jgi:hypothetical protein